jgi:hypothetical protein
MRSVAALALLLVALPGCFDGLLGGLTAAGPTDYLRGSTYTKWVIEVDYATGHAPSDDLLSFLHDRLAAVVDKPEGVEFRLGESLTDADRSWTDDDLRSYAASHADESTGGQQVVLHLLFLAGHSSADNGDGKVLGVTFGHGPIAIFAATVDHACDANPLPHLGCSVPAVYKSVVLHEFGHALGLVNNGIPMVKDHEAKSCNGANPKAHSANQNSVMFCTVDTSAVIALSAPPSSFDADDLADLHAAGGKP